MDLGATLGTAPIFVALLGLGAAAVLFRRLTATYLPWRFALGDALRAAVVYGVLLLLLAIVFRGANDDLSRELQSELEVGGEGDLGHGANVPTSLLLGILVMFVVLALACFLRRDRLGYRPLPNLGVWMALMFVTVSLLARLASVHATGELEYSVDPEVAAEQGLDENRATVHADLFAGLPSGDALLIPLIGVLVGLAVAAATGALDVRRVASQLQQTPGGDQDTLNSA